MVDGFVVAAPVTSGGSGYVTSPAVTIVGRSVLGAGAYSSISGGVVTGITVTNAGYGYTNTVTIQIAPPPAAAVFPTVLPVMRVDSANLAPYDNYQLQFTPDITARVDQLGWRIVQPDSRDQFTISFHHERHRLFPPAIYAVNGFSVVEFVNRKLGLIPCGVLQNACWIFSRAYCKLPR